MYVHVKFGFSFFEYVCVLKCKHTGKIQRGEPDESGQKRD